MPCHATAWRRDGDAEAERGDPARAFHEAASLARRDEEAHDERARDENRVATEREARGGVVAAGARGGERGEVRDGRGDREARAEKRTVARDEHLDGRVARRAGEGRGEPGSCDGEEERRRDEEDLREAVAPGEAGRGRGGREEREREGWRVGDEPLAVERERRKSDDARRGGGRRGGAAGREGVRDRDRRIGERDELRRREHGRVVAARLGDAAPRDDDPEREERERGAGPSRDDRARLRERMHEHRRGEDERHGTDAGATAAAARAPATAKAIAAGSDGWNARPSVRSAEAIAMGTKMPRSIDGA